MKQEASTRYELTWNKFTNEVKNNPKITLRTVCKTMHTDPKLMGKWMSRHGLSVFATKKKVCQELTKETSSTFAVLVPKDNPSDNNELSLSGISITFNSGTTINIKQGDAESIIRLISLYERKDGALCTL